MDKQIDIQDLVIQLKGKGMTQRQIADALGCSQPTISDYESGKIGKANPSHRMVEGIKKLARKKCIYVK